MKKCKIEESKLKTQRKTNTLAKSMLFLSVIFVFLAESFAFNIEKLDSENLKLTSQSDWKIKGPDEQIYSLLEEKVADMTFYGVAAFRGAHQIRMRPITEKKWKKFRSRFTFMINSVQNKKECGHAFEFVVEQKSKVIKNKLFCYKYQSKDDQALLKDLVDDLRGYLLASK